MGAYQGGGTYGIWMYRPLYGAGGFSDEVVFPDNISDIAHSFMAMRSGCCVFDRYRELMIGGKETLLERQCQRNARRTFMLETPQILKI